MNGFNTTPSLINIHWCSTEGGGVNEVISVPESSTIGDVFTARSSHANKKNYKPKLRRNGTATMVDWDMRLQDGDRVTVVAEKTDGAE